MRKSPSDSSLLDQYNFQINNCYQNPKVKKYDFTRICKGSNFNAYNKLNLGSIPTKTSHILFKGVRKSELNILKDKFKYQVNNSNYEIEGENIKYSFSNLPFNHFQKMINKLKNKPINSNFSSNNNSQLFSSNMNSSFVNKINVFGSNKKDKPSNISNDKALNKKLEIFTNFNSNNSNVDSNINVISNNIISNNSINLINSSNHNNINNSNNVNNVNNSNNLNLSNNSIHSHNKSQTFTNNMKVDKSITTSFTNIKNPYTIYNFNSSLENYNILPRRKFNKDDDSNQENVQLENQSNNETTYYKNMRANQIINPELISPNNNRNTTQNLFISYTMSQLNGKNKKKLFSRFNDYTTYASRYLPGPGEYDPIDETKTNKFINRYKSLFKCGSNQPLIKEIINLGPGEYDVNISSVNNNNSKNYMSSTFSKGKKDFIGMLLKNKNELGPGCYNIPDGFNVKNKGHLSYFFIRKDDKKSNSVNLENKWFKENDFISDGGKNNKEMNFNQVNDAENTKNNIKEMRKYLKLRKKRSFHGLNYSNSHKNIRLKGENSVNSDKIKDGLKGKKIKISNEKNNFRKMLLRAQLMMPRSNKGFSFDLSPKREMKETSHNPGPCYYDYEKILNFLNNKKSKKKF